MNALYGQLTFKPRVFVRPSGCKVDITLTGSRGDRSVWLYGGGGKNNTSGETVDNERQQILKICALKHKHGGKFDVTLCLTCQSAARSDISVKFVSGKTNARE